MAAPRPTAAHSALAPAPVDLAEARGRIAELAHLNAFISLSEEQGEGPIVAVKDLIDVMGMVTTGGGRILPEEPAGADAQVIGRIRAHGGVIVGKTNLHEWAYGSTSINPHFGPVRNPVDPELIAGGSSGGSAVAVACGMCAWAIGTDTAGSLRIPASLCGVVSIKPTYGRVPTEGVIPLSRSLDTVGPIAADVAAAAAALAIMTGSRAGLAASTSRADLAASTSRADLAASHPLDPGSLRIGRAPDSWVVSLDQPTAAAWQAVAAPFPEVSIPDRVRASEVCTTISMYEASRFHRRWVLEHPERYGDEDVRDRLLAGLEISREEYDRAIAERSTLAAAFDDAISGWDAILAPATAMVAQPIDGADVREPMTRFTRPFATTGQPVVTIPAPATGLPVGIQVVARRNDDAKAVQAALALEAEWQ
jgi:aspartyl-tRNA(Asn)/glutamyl-tRNA(Gln) amidotransferase subunit A